MSRTLYNYDKPFEEMIGKWLDCYFYKKVLSVDQYKITRETSTERQHQGIDVYCERISDHRIFNIDEKCAAHYVNSNLRTFAFEILANEKRTEDDGNGWLIKKGNKTELYNLIWIHADEQRFPFKKGSTLYYQEMAPESIKFLVCCIVKKDRILKFLLEDHNFENIINLEKQARLIRAKPLNKKDKQYGKSFEIKNDLKFTYSCGLAEGPVNVLIDMVDLQKLATVNGLCKCYKVDTSGIEKGFDLLDSLK